MGLVQSKMQTATEVGPYSLKKNTLKLNPSSFLKGFHFLYTDSQP